MKNFTPWHWILIIFAIGIVYVWALIFTGMVVFKIPTTPANSELRKELIGMINNATITILAIIAMVINSTYNNNNKP